MHSALITGSFRPGGLQVLFEVSEGFGVVNPGQVVFQGAERILWAVQ